MVINLQLEYKIFSFKGLSKILKYFYILHCSAQLCQCITPAISFNVYKEQHHF